MRRNRLLASVVIGVATMTSQTGCALMQGGTSEEIYFETQEIFITVVSAALIARDAGLITEEEWSATWAPIIAEGNDLLTELETAEDARAVVLRQILVGVLRRLATARSVNGDF